MTKEELIRYLDACIDAEEGLYESKRLAEQIETELKLIDRKVYEEIPPDLPDKPVMDPPFKDGRESAQQWIDTCKKHISTAYLSLDFKEVKEWKESLSKAEGKLREAEFEYLNRAEIEKNRIDRFEAANQEWQEKNKKYQYSILMQGEMIYREVYNEKTKQEERVAAFQKSLDELYGMEILYKDFRNPDAMWHLREYLAMGIADTLEGPNGAYRFYMDDLRADKIVGSIKELRESVEKGFYYVLVGQQKTREQLVEMDNSLKEIDRNMGAYFDRLNSQIKETGRTIAREISDASRYEQELLGNIQKDQAAIGRIIENSAYNQYLVDRWNNVDNYLIYQLHNPLL